MPLRANNALRTHNLHFIITNSTLNQTDMESLKPSLGKTQWSLYFYRVQSTGTYKLDALRLKSVLVWQALSQTKRVNVDSKWGISINNSQPALWKRDERVIGIKNGGIGDAAHDTTSVYTAREASKLELSHYRSLWRRALAAQTASLLIMRVAF